MFFKKLFGGFIGAPVGNGMDNEEEDVRRVRTGLEETGHLAAEEKRERDYMSRPLGIITRTLENGIRDFQRDNDLKEDGWLAPGGETEAALVQKLRQKQDAAVSMTRAQEETIVHDWVRQRQLQSKGEEEPEDLPEEKPETPPRPGRKPEPPKEKPDCSELYGIWQNSIAVVKVIEEKLEKTIEALASKRESMNNAADHVVEISKRAPVTIMVSITPIGRFIRVIARKIIKAFSDKESEAEKALAEFEEAYHVWQQTYSKSSEAVSNVEYTKALLKEAEKDSDEKEAGYRKCMEGEEG